MTAVVLNGVTYSDVVTAGAKHLDEGGHVDNFIPLLQDMVTHTDGVITTSESYKNQAETASTVAIAARDDTQVLKADVEAIKANGITQMNAIKDAAVVDLNVIKADAANYSAQAGAHVVSATQQADRAKSEADRAASVVAGVNFPPITPDDYGKVFAVKADGTGYETKHMRLPYAGLTQAGALSPNTHYQFTGTSPITVTLPIAPALGDRLVIEDRNGQMQQSPVTVESQQPMEVAGNKLTLDKNKVRATFRWNGVEWRITL